VVHYEHHACLINKMLRVHPWVAIVYRLYWGIMFAIVLVMDLPVLTTPLTLAIVWSLIDVYQEVPHVAYFVLVQLTRMGANIALLILHLLVYYGSSSNSWVSSNKEWSLANLLVLLAFDVYSGLAFHYFSSMERKQYTEVPMREMK